MMFLEGPADTTNYMIAGYSVILGTMGLYILSLILRFRGLSQDEALLDELNIDEA